MTVIACSAENGRISSFENLTL